MIMRVEKNLKYFLSLFFVVLTMVILSSCVGDQSVAKNRGSVKDFSKVKTNKNGCGDLFLIFKTPDTCTNTCAQGTHLATLEELSKVKTDLVAQNNTALLTIVNGSANICVDDVIVEERPTNVIDIKNDFCSCIDGKSDIINNCDNFCAAKGVSNQPILYVNTTVGPEIALNTKLGNVFNWCSVQLANDEEKPQCFLNATDGLNTLNLPVNLIPNSNSFNANILSLAPNRTWILKLVETKSGSNAQSKEFQVRRKIQTADTGGALTGALKVTPISQYSCMTYGGKVDNLGKIIRTTFARIFYYFAANETPPPIPPSGGTNESLVVCHDEQLHPGVDSAEYSRLELIPNFMAMWDKSDVRFVAKAENAGKLTINKILEDRLSTEFNINGSSISLFTLISFPNRPTTTTTASANVPLGYMMIPFTNPDTGKSFCPTSTNFNGNQPLFNLLGEYMDDTEGLYLAEKEAETVADGNSFKTLYGTMFVRESILKSHGFFIENGLKIKADEISMHTRTIYFYWPLNDVDPLTQGNRKLFTVRTPATLNGNVPTGQATFESTTDKRIGCVPKSQN